jgi:PAS domain S-box-containing protein
MKRQPALTLPPGAGLEYSTVRGTRRISTRFILAAIGLNALVGGAMVFYDVVDDLTNVRNNYKSQADRIADLCDRLYMEYRDERRAVDKTSALTDSPMALVSHKGQITYATSDTIVKALPQVYDRPPTVVGTEFEVREDLGALSGAWALRPFTTMHKVLVIIPRHPEEEGVLRYMTVGAGLVGLGVIISFLAMMLTASRLLQRPLTALVEQLTGALSRALGFRNNLIDASESVGMFATDSKGKIIVYNRAAEKILGYKESDVIGRLTIDEFRALTHRQPTQELPHRSLFQVTQGQEFLVDVQGRELLVETKTSDILEEDGNTNGRLVIFIDITERKRLEVELQLNELQLIQSAKLASVGEMATGVAHELNQPLNNIGLLCSRIVKRFRGPTREDNVAFALEKLNRIQSQVHRASKIISQLRVFGRPAERDVSSLSIARPVDNVLDLLGEQIRSSGIIISVELSEKLPKVMADEAHLEQVLINLLNNARDALVSDLSGQGQKTIQITADEAELDGQPAITLNITDNGPGISPPVRDKIFQPFFTTKDVGKGTGLGLSISYGLVRGLGGTLDVKSELGKGATFTICLKQATVAKHGTHDPNPADR